MRIAIWDILAVLVLLAMCITASVFAQILMNPYSSMNPFPPQSLPPTIVIPTSTPTLRSLPATWTPGGPPTETPEGATVAPSRTPYATQTGFVLPSFTPTPTNTSTPTVTRTATSTRTATPIPTKTNVPTATDDLTATANALVVTNVAGTEQANAQATAVQAAIYATQTMEACLAIPGYDPSTPCPPPVIP